MFFLIALVFGVLAWCAWHISVRDASILYAALAFLCAAICIFFMFGVFIR